MLIRHLSLVALAIVMSSPLVAQDKVLAVTPPMGWNSWDSYGLTITEPQFRANVTVLKEKLLPFGYNYAVVDEGWFFQNPQDRPTPEKLIYAIDRNGRYVPVPSRFPSSVVKGAKSAKDSSGKGMKQHVTFQSTNFNELSRWIHAQGFKFGIHIVRGIPRASVERNLSIEGSAFHAQDVADQNDACPWDPTNWGVKNNAAGQAWYDSLMRQYAAWGVDLVKVYCISSHPYKADEIRMIHNAIAKTGRPIVLSLSPGPTSLDNAAEVGELAQMWRISDDFWDYWASPTKNDYPQSVLGQFTKLAAWAKYTKPGNWPDADMLPLGTLGPVPGEGKPRATRLTHDEQRTLITLWSMARSPLILGANLTKLDDWTLALLTNPTVIAIDQHSTDGHEVLHNGDAVAWLAKGDAGKLYLALFNQSDTEAKGKAFAAYGLDEKSYSVQDVWSRGNSSFPPGLEEITIPPHGCVLLELHEVKPPLAK
jgi:hypothetical protein